MSIRILTDEHNETAVLYDSVTEQAFGPLIHHEDDAESFATEFIDSIPIDVLRVLSHEEISAQLGRFVQDYESNKAERSHERWLESYYGASTPQTLDEICEQARKLK